MLQRGHMKRREFIAFVGGATLWPFAALGQQVALRIVGVLGLGSVESSHTFLAPAQRRLTEMGYVEGRNLVVEYRGDSQEDRLAELARDLVQRRIEAIVALGGPPIAAAKAATTSIPVIFFTGYDVVSGFVASLNQPGGNLILMQTWCSNDLRCFAS
jgi:putative ABC transport system substrate-binding protein